MLTPDDDRGGEFGGGLVGGPALVVIGAEWAAYILPALIGFVILRGSSTPRSSPGTVPPTTPPGEASCPPESSSRKADRILYRVLVLELATDVAGRGNVFVLGEAYAFGMVRAFLPLALPMTPTRFPRAWGRIREGSEH